MTIEKALNKELAQLLGIYHADIENSNNVMVTTDIDGVYSVWNACRNWNTLMPIAIELGVYYKPAPARIGQFMAYNLVYSGSVRAFDENQQIALVKGCIEALSVQLVILNEY